MNTESHNYKPRVTVAISAFNEERNIGAFLRSVLMQKEDGFELVRILVISDGSADGTAGVVRDLASPKAAEAGSFLAWPALSGPSERDGHDAQDSCAERIEERSVNGFGESSGVYGCRDRH